MKIGSARDRHLFVAGALATIGFYSVANLPLGVRWDATAKWTQFVIFLLALPMSIALLYGATWSVRAARVYIGFLIVLGIFVLVTDISRPGAQAIHSRSEWRIAFLTLGELFLLVLSFGSRGRPTNDP